MSIKYGPGFELKASATKNNRVKIDVPLLETTMAQSSYFKISIEQLNNPSMSNRIFGEFLPIKSMTFTPVSLEMTTIPIGIFGDMSIVTRKKVGKFNITLADTNEGYYEKELNKWYHLSVPSNTGHVGYLEDIVSDMLYVSYTTTGKVNSTLNLQVMLSEDMTITRDYDSNDLKTITFSVVVVGSVESLTESISGFSSYIPPVTKTVPKPAAKVEPPHEWAVGTI